MAEKMMLEVLTPERLFFRGEVEEIIVTASDGEVGILPNHTSMTAALDNGLLRIRDNGWHDAVCAEGFMLVRNNEVSIMVQSALWPHEVDVARAENELRMAEEALRQRNSRLEYLKNKGIMMRAMARLRVARHSVNE